MLTPLAVRKKRPTPAPRPPEPLHLRAQDKRYFLEVRLQIAAQDQDDFVRGGIELLPTFEANGLTLIASAWRTSTDPIMVNNYWDIGDDADRLLLAELALPDIPKFNAFNRLIKGEVKTIAIPIAPNEPRALPKPRGKQKLAESFRYLRVSMEVASPQLPEFGARIEAYMQRFTTNMGWYLGETFYGITGTAGAISQLWVIPSSDPHNIADSRTISQKLEVAPWLSRELLRAPATFEILRATPADPNLAGSKDSSGA